MKVMVLDPRVQKNLTLFRHLVKKNMQHHVAQRVYHAFINRKTGEWAFPELDKSPHEKDEWEGVVIHLHSEGCFDVEEEGCPDCFHCDELEPQAFRTLGQTVHILNELCYEPKKHGVKRTLRNVSHFEFEMPTDKSYVDEVWHNVDRIEAEYMLKHEQKGSYLFRKDEFAVALEESLNEKRGMPVTCITLSYLTPKFCEKTLVYDHKSWQIYNDDPQLKGQAYTSMELLLQALGLSHPHRR